MMFEGGGAASVWHKVAEINDKYEALSKGKNRQQIIALNKQRQEEICRINPRYGRGGK